MQKSFIVIHQVIQLRPKAGFKFCFIVEGLYIIGLYGHKLVGSITDHLLQLGSRHLVSLVILGSVQRAALVPSRKIIQVGRKLFACFRKIMLDTKLQAAGIELSLAFRAPLAEPGELAAV